MSYLSRILLVITLFASYVATSKQPPANNSDPLPQRAAVHFQISCTSEAGELFDRAIVRLHSFSNEQAEMEFRAVSEKDPACAMAYWDFLQRFYSVYSYLPPAAH